MLVLVLLLLLWLLLLLLLLWLLLLLQRATRGGCIELAHCSKVRAGGGRGSAPRRQAVRQEREKC
jgi:hypothetical protein